ncbi:MAG TPA: LuxR C-terminal-related transcriptional regulator [Tepidisphaeraceae bacterium]
MLGSQRLRLREHREAAELLGEVIELGSDAAVWRPHFLRGMSKLLGAQVVLSLDCEGAFPGSQPRLVSPLDLGWESVETRNRFYQYFTQGDVKSDPAAVALFAQMQRTRFSTTCRRDLVDDQAWYGSPTVYEARRSGNVDDFVCSCVALAPGLLHGFIVYRGWGEQPFETRQRRLARFAHVLLLRALQARASDRGVMMNVAELSPRLRQTLELLVAGDGMKQIAMKLGISHHTVNDYIKALYKRAEVSSRAELVNQLRARPASRLALPPVFELAMAIQGRSANDHSPIASTE